MSNPYETQRLVDEYLLFHYGEITSPLTYLCNVFINEHRLFLFKLKKIHSPRSVVLKQGFYGCMRNLFT